MTTPLQKHSIQFADILNNGSTVTTIFSCLSETSFRDTLRLASVNRELHEIGKAYLTRYVACENCNNILATAKQAWQQDQASNSFPFHLHDGGVVCFGDPDEDMYPGSIILSPEQRCTNPMLTHEFCRRLRESPETLDLHLRHASCSQCKLYLGIQITQVKGKRAGQPLDISSWRLGLLLGNAFICHKYLSVLRKNKDGACVEEYSLPGITWQDRVPRRLYKCSACELPLFYDTAVLSKEHSWIADDIVNGATGTRTQPAATSGEHQEHQEQQEQQEEEIHTEPAWCVNTILSHLVESDAEEADLTQGKMAVTRTFCPGCHRNLGWRFKQCLSAEDQMKNVHYCGRYGFLAGRLQVEIATSIRTGLEGGVRGVGGGGGQMLLTLHHR